MNCASHWGEKSCCAVCALYELDKALERTTALESRAIAAEKERDTLRANYESAMKATQNVRKEADRWLQIATEWQRQCEEAEASLRAKPRPVEREVVGWIVRWEWRWRELGDWHMAEAKRENEQRARELFSELKQYESPFYERRNCRLIRVTRPKKAEVGK